jgi:hypothetical protein
MIIISCFEKDLLMLKTAHYWGETRRSSAIVAKLIVIKIDRNMHHQETTDVVTSLAGLSPMAHA